MFEPLTRGSEDVHRPLLRASARLASRLPSEPKPRRADPPPPLGSDHDVDRAGRRWPDGDVHAPGRPLCASTPAVSLALGAAVELMLYGPAGRGRSSLPSLAEGPHHPLALLPFLPDGNLASAAHLGPAPATSPAPAARRGPRRRRRGGRRRRQAARGHHAPEPQARRKLARRLVEALVDPGRRALPRGESFGPVLGAAGAETRGRARRGLGLRGARRARPARQALR